jgi:hypothetical protein
MGLMIRRARFDGGRPTVAQVVDRARSLGGLPLLDDHDQIQLVDIPDMCVAVGQPETWPDCIDLTDFSEHSEVLLLLVEHSLVSLGGHFDPPPKPLPLPLTLDFVRRDLRRNERINRAGCGGISMLALAVAIATAIGLAWIGMQALLAG